MSDADLPAADWRHAAVGTGWVWAVAGAAVAAAVGLFELTSGGCSGPSSFCPDPAGLAIIVGALYALPGGAVGTAMVWAGWALARRRGSATTVRWVCRAPALLLAVAATAGLVGLTVW